MKTVLAASFDLGKRISLVAMVSCWVLPASAELNVDNSQNIIITNHAIENETFRQTIRLMKSPKDFRFLQVLRGQIDGDSKETDILKKYSDLSLVFEFATIEGSISGAVTGAKLAQIAIENEDKLTLFLPKRIETKTIDMPELTINDYGTPVHFARLSTLSKIDNSYSGSAYRASGAGFMDGNTGSYLVLVYSSDKVRMSGKIEEGRDDYNYRVSLPHQGWHWLKLKKKGNNVEVTRVDNDKVDPIIYAF